MTRRWHLLTYWAKQVLAGLTKTILPVATAIVAAATAADVGAEAGAAVIQAAASQAASYCGLHSGKVSGNAWGSIGNGGSGGNKAATEEKNCQRLRRQIDPVLQKQASAMPEAAALACEVSVGVGDSRGGSFDV